MTIREAAKKWGLSVERVIVLANNNRIPNMKKKMTKFRWDIPDDAPRPVPKIRGRGKKTKRREYLEDYFRRHPPESKPEKPPLLPEEKDYYKAMLAEDAKKNKPEEDDLLDNVFG